VRFFDAFRGRLLLSVVGAMLVAASVAVTFIVRDELRRPNVAAVVDAARGPATEGPELAVTRSVDGLEFPDWRRWSWRAVGGRRDVLEDDREAATTIYRHGKQTITYSIVSGTGNVDADEYFGFTRQVTTPGGKVELVESGGPNVMILRRMRGGRTIILTGVPPGKRLARTMRRLAVRGTT
jgi:hypothetical protein